MTHFNLALLGFGNVGQSLARLLQRKAPSLSRDNGITFTVTAIGTGRHGAAEPAVWPALRRGVGVLAYGLRLPEL